LLTDWIDCVWKDTLPVGDYTFYSAVNDDADNGPGGTGLDSMEVPMEEEGKIKALLRALFEFAYRY
jgi:hypothetical protein